MGTINIYDRMEFSGPLGSVSIGNLSRPKTVTAASNLHHRRPFTLADNDPATKVYDETTDLADPVLIRIEWDGGPVEIAWGEDATASNSDTSSFVSGSGAGFLYLFGSGQVEHDGQSVVDRFTETFSVPDTLDNTHSDVGIGKIYMMTTSATDVNVVVDAFK